MYTSKYAQYERRGGYREGADQGQEGADQGQEGANYRDEKHY